MKLSEVTMKYGRLVVFIRHDSAEILGFRYGLALGIGTLKIMASTGVFVRVVSALKRSVRCYSQTPSKATHKTNRTPIENSGKLDKV